MEQFYTSNIYTTGVAMNKAQKQPNLVPMVFGYPKSNQENQKI